MSDDRIPSRELPPPPKAVQEAVDLLLQAHAAYRRLRGPERIRFSVELLNSLYDRLDVQLVTTLMFCIPEGQDAAGREQLLLPLVPFLQAIHNPRVFKAFKKHRDRKDDAELSLAVSAAVELRDREKLTWAEIAERLHREHPEWFRDLAPPPLDKQDYHLLGQRLKQASQRRKKRDGTN
jgi:hypothetical protein